MAKALLINPRKRRKAPARKTARKAVAKRTRRASPRKAAVVRRRRRNPVRKDIIQDQVMPALVGGAGAIGINILFEQLPLPEQYKSGMLRYGVEAASIVGLGMVLDKAKLGKPKMRNQVTSGAMTVLAYRFIMEQLPADVAVQAGASGLSGFQFPRRYPSSNISGYQSIGYTGSGMNVGTNVSPINPMMESRATV